MLRVLKILEMAWLLIGIFSVLAGAYFFNQHGWDASKWFFGGALIAGVFFAFRRRQRLKFEQSEKKNPNN
jgi:uncharacterized membrane protein YfcA